MATCNATHQGRGIEELEANRRSKELPVVLASELDQENRDLARQGIQPVLKREFNQFSTISFAASVSACFATVCTTFRFPLRAGGAAAAIYCWWGGGLMALTLAFSVAELTSAYTTSGGIYHAASKLAPRKWAAFAAWVVGWLNLFGQICGVASVEYGAAEILLATVSALNHTYRPAPQHTVAVMVAGTILTGIINSMNTKWLSKTTASYVVFHGITIVICCTTLLYMCKDKHSVTYVATHFESSSGWEPQGYSVLFGLLSVSWVITDYDASSHIAEEVKTPEKVVPRAIGGAMTLAYLFGGLFTTSLVFVMGDPSEVLSTHLDQPVIQIFVNVLGPAGGAVFAFAAYVIMKMCAITAMQALGRTVFAFSRDKLIPGHWIWTRTNRTTGTPIYAVWLCVLICISVDLIALASTVAITAIFNLTVIALDLSYVIVVLLKIFSKTWQRGPIHLGRLSLFLDWMGCAWTIFITVLFLQPVVMPVEASTMNYAVVFFVALLVWIFGSWYLVGRKHFKGPSSHVDMVESSPPSSSRQDSVDDK
ncbi:Amino acid permease-like protein 4 [Elsinoe fawcettii]|nr:Amino acid permease-like protein 4 [Elsinoe fawcettii]